MTQQEQTQFASYGRAAFNSLLDSALSDAMPRWLRELREEAKRGKLSKQQLWIAKVLARGGYQEEIQKILAENG